MDPYHYYSEYQVLVCKACQQAVRPAHFTAHLRGENHSLTRQESEEIVSRYKNFTLVDPTVQVVGPTTLVHPIDHLQIYRDGLLCAHCNFIYRAERVIKQH